jgi:hypothetical protein
MPEPIGAGMTYWCPMCIARSQEIADLRTLLREVLAAEREMADNGVPYATVISREWIERARKALGEER